MLRRDRIDDADPNAILRFAVVPRNGSSGVGLIRKALSSHSKIPESSPPPHRHQQRVEHRRLQSKGLIARSRTIVRRGDADDHGNGNDERIAVLERSTRNRRDTGTLPELRLLSSILASRLLHALTAVNGTKPAIVAQQQFRP
jgi:hypothetical protein